MMPRDFQVRSLSKHALHFTGGLMLRFARHADEEATAIMECNGVRDDIENRTYVDAEDAVML